MSAFEFRVRFCADASQRRGDVRSLLRGALPPLRRSPPPPPPCPFVHVRCGFASVSSCLPEPCQEHRCGNAHDASHATTTGVTPQRTRGDAGHQRRCAADLRGGDEGCLGECRPHPAPCVCVPARSLCAEQNMRKTGSAAVFRKHNGRARGQHTQTRQHTQQREEEGGRLVADRRTQRAPHASRGMLSVHSNPMRPAAVCLSPPVPCAVPSVRRVRGLRCAS